MGIETKTEMCAVCGVQAAEVSAPRGYDPAANGGRGGNKYAPECLPCAIGDGWLWASEIGDDCRTVVIAPNGAQVPYAAWNPTPQQVAEWAAIERARA